MTITGPGAANLTIGAARASQVFQVDSTVTGVGATISGVTIENGFNSTSSGGGISNYGTLAVTDSSLVNNGGGFLYGGGIYNNGTMTVSNCSLVNNESSTGGGGIFNDSGGTMTVSNSTLSGNESVGLGGGIGNLGMLTVTDSTLSGNILELEGEGGGIGNGGTLIMSNSTVSGNIAYPFKAFPGQGGGIFSDGTATISFSTIVGNAAYSEQGNSGGGISQTGGTLTLKSTLLANNSAAGNCSGTGTSDGYNLSDDGSCAFLTATGDRNGVTGAATYLGPLQNNGGPTTTVALLSGSPGSTAIDAVPLSACTDAFGNPVITDQRGVYRPQGSSCDIGAYELTQVPTANVCPNGQSTPSPCSAPITLQYYIPSGTTLNATNPVHVVTQGTAGLDFNLASSGDTCTASLAGPAYCSAPVTFAPITPGVRFGASTLFDSNGNLVASYLISGIGNAPAIAFTPSPQSALSISVPTPPSTLSNPDGVAVDAAGDIFIVDSQNNRIVEVPGGTGTPVVVPATGLSSPGGVAVDGAGDVFIADTQNKQVVEVPASGGSQVVVASGFLTPVAVAVDGAGDLFVVDLGANQVVEIPANNGPRTVVGTGSYTLSSPQGIAVDAAGDIFIADTGNTRVLEVPAGGGSASIVSTTGLAFVSSVAVDAAGDVFIGDASSNDRIVEVPAGGGSQFTVTNTGFILPAAVAVDGTGNVYIADYEGNQVVKVNRSQPPTLTFATTLAGQTSTSPQPVTVQNIGNENLTGSLALTLGGNFTQNVSPDCASEFPLAAGTTCSESFSFTPQTGGSLTGTAVFTDNTLNYSPDVQQTISLSGTATVAVPSVVGELAATAETAITSAGLTYTTSSATSNAVMIGDVISENPMAGTVVSGGTSVSLVISTGPAQYLLTTAASPASGGTVSPATGNQNANAVVPISATPKPGYVFSNWSGAVSGSTNPTKVTMSGPESVTANFVPALSLSQNLLSFGDVNLGSTKYLNVTVKNISTSSFKITNITFNYGKGTGSNFGYTTECGGTLAPGKSCVIAVDLFAQDVGTGAATLNILYNLPSSPVTVGLTGTVIDPKARLNESSINFGEVKEGQSATSTVTLTSTGVTPLLINNISISGNSDFSQSNLCPSSMNPNASCTITVTFKPTAKKSESATLEISDNASSSPQTVSLSGTGH